MGTNESLTSPQNAAAKRPKVIGLCGGIASGKSAVASELERLGAIVIRADQIGHTVLEDPEVNPSLAPSRLHCRVLPSQRSFSLIILKLLNI
jgi:hypothetical protein